MQTNTAPPIFDISDIEVKAAQSHNVVIFRKRQLRVVLGLISFFSGPLLLGPILSQEYDGVIIGLMFASGIFLVFSMLLYRCPNCAAQPSGEAASFAGEINYTRGINPFPKRCKICGFYLSKGALEKDIHRQSQ